MKSILLLIISLATPCFAQEMQLFNPNDTGFHILELDELMVNYKDFFPNGHSPLVTENGIPNRQLGKELSLQMNTSLLKYMYWNNMVHGTTDEVPGTSSGQFRAIGYQFELGVRLFNWFETEYHHHSQHELDNVWPYGHWPVEDAISIKIYLWRKEQKNSIF